MTETEAMETEAMEAGSTGRSGTLGRLAPAAVLGG